jgi:2-phosphoglycerate kinase
MQIEGEQGPVGEASPLAEQLQHVYWIGGGSGAGKSTIARDLATKYGLHLYSTDEMMLDHGKRSTPENCPFTHEFKSLSMDERWVNRSPETMLETFHWFKGEGFSLIIEDLLNLPNEPGVIVEGFRLLPQLVKPFLSVVNHAVWLLPTPDFRQSVFNNRGGSAWGFLGQTSNPEKALRNLLARDQMFTDRLHAETKRLNLPTVVVDTTMTENDLAERVKNTFGL